MKKMKNNNNHGYCKHVYGKYNRYHSFTSQKQIFDDFFDKSSTNITLMIADDNFHPKDLPLQTRVCPPAYRKKITIINWAAVHICTYCENCKGTCIIQAVVVGRVCSF